MSVATHTGDRQKIQQSFWQNMADKYPLPFAAKTLADTQRIIGIVEAAGTRIDGAEILDIGCGTGIYTLPLALRAAKVTGIDSSEKMLAACNREKKAHNLENVRTLLLDWSTADLDALGFSKSFDVVWASMTPAVRSESDLVKFRNCARKSCIYIEWGNVRKNELLEEVFAAHNCFFGPPPGTAAMKTLLHAQGIQCQTTPVQSHWDWQGSEEEACRNAAGYLQVSSDTEINWESIQRIVARYCRDGVVYHRTDVEMEVLTWHEN